MPVYSARIKEWREELERLTRVLTNAHGVRLGRKGMIKDGIKYCDKCGEQTWHAVSVWPDPTQCPLCEDCCCPDRNPSVAGRTGLIRVASVHLPSERQETAERDGTAAGA